MISIQKDNALKYFFSRATVPIFHDYSGKTAPLGTGTFFYIGEKLILLTASHILTATNVCAENLAIPYTWEGSDFQTLGAINLYKINDNFNSDIDIVAIEILDENLKNRFQKGWRILDVSIGGQLCPEKEFLLVGFPALNFKIDNDNDKTKLKSQPLYINTKLKIISIDNEKKYSNCLDFFLEDKCGTLQDNTLIEIDTISGMSGCAIWQMRDIDNIIWSADKNLKLVGIQSSQKKNDYLRCKNWNYIDHLIKRLTDK